MTQHIMLEIQVLTWGKYGRSKLANSIQTQYYIYLDKYVCKQINYTMM